MRPRWAQTSRAERILAQRYPFGLAKGSSVIPSRRPAIPLRALFVADLPDAQFAMDDCFSGEQGALLKKAIVQGLRWKIEQAHLVYARSSVDEKSPLSATLERGRQDLAREIEERSPLAIIALGAYAQQLFGIADKKGWIKKGGRLFYPSIDLRDVLTDASKKRAFWSDLQEVATVSDLPTNADQREG